VVFQSKSAKFDFTPYGCAPVFGELYVFLRRNQPCGWSQTLTMMTKIKIDEIASDPNWHDVLPSSQNLALLAKLRLPTKRKPVPPWSGWPPEVNTFDQNTIGDQFFDCALTKRDSLRQLFEVEVFAHVFLTLL
jgi:hypothetical protein